MNKPTRRHFLHQSLATAAALGLVGCGFRLRGYGNANVPVPPTTIVGNSPVAQLLKNQLKTQNAWAENAQNAQLILTVINDQHKRVASTANSSTQAREVELSQVFRFSIQNHEGIMLVSEQTISTQRFLSYSESQVAAKEAEINLLFTNMRQNIVQQVMTRLQTLATVDASNNK